MRNRTGISLGIALALLFAAVFASTAGAENRRRNNRDSDLLRLETFNVSGEFSGSMSGEIRLDGVRYQLAPTVQVYEIGRGLIPVGSDIDDRYVYLSGVKTMGSDLIFSVIVRPAVQPSLDRDDPASHIRVRVKDPSAE